MPSTFQQQIADATLKASQELKEALANIPADKREWKPAETARSAADIAAECALLTGYTADVVAARAWQGSNDLSPYFTEKSKLSTDWDAILALLDVNAPKAAAIFRDVPDDALATVIQMPWGDKAIAEMMGYPYWNLSYHLGQINYIASILGCLP